MSHQTTCASALAGKTGKRKSCIFPSNAALVHSLPEFNQLLDFFNLFDSQLIFVLLYDSLNLVINVFSHRDCWGHGSEERRSLALQQLDCVAHAVHQYAVFWLFCQVMLKHYRWGGKTKHHMIPYILSNISAKNYRNRIVYAKIVANRRWDVFLRCGVHVCMCVCVWVHCNSCYNMHLTYDRIRDVQWPETINSRVFLVVLLRYPKQTPKPRFLQKPSVAET